MTLTYMQQGRRAAFTLVELLVVIGLMAVLATMSVAGYSAATRGMADRGVIQTTVSILRIARQTCQIDRVPTKVMFFNQKLDTGQNDEADLFQGTAIAIKQAGRITIPSKATEGARLLIDEFADWQQSYPRSGSDSAPKMRIYRMKESDKDGGFTESSAQVLPFVTHYQLRDDYMIQAGVTFKDWCDRHDCKGNDYVWGFKISGGEDWEVGDPYGVEIARIDLPRGYIFGTSAPKSAKPVAASVKAVYFDAEELDPSPSANVPISAIRPAAGGRYAVKEVGTVKKDMLDEGKK